jgi:16S rRNA processing protein RimM
MSSELVVIGRVVKIHGNKGWVLLCFEDIDNIELALGQSLFLGSDESNVTSMTIEDVRRIAAGMLVSFQNICDRQSASNLAGLLVYLPVDKLKPLGEGAYYHFQLVGLKVITTDGRLIGVLSDVMQTGANDVYVVQADQKEYLIPAIRSVIKTVDLSTGTMLIEDMPNMLDQA